VIGIVTCVGSKCGCGVRVRDMGYEVGCWGVMVRDDRGRHGWAAQCCSWTQSGVWVGCTCPCPRPRNRALRARPPHSNCVCVRIQADGGSWGSHSSSCVLYSRPSCSYTQCASPRVLNGCTLLGLGHIPIMFECFGTTGVRTII
jgi:hypothetical protein